MYSSKKFGVSAALVGMALASCQLIVACGDSNDLPVEAGGGNAGSSGGGASAGRAGSPSGGKTGMTGGAGEATNGGSGEGGEPSETGGMPSGGLSSSAGMSGTAGSSGGSAGTIGGAAGSGGSGGHAGSGGTAGSGGHAGGTAGSGGTAGHAGSGGSNAGMGGTAGAAGLGGHGGAAGGSSGGTGGTGPVCGNGIVESGEVCDSKFTVNDCGADCHAITPSACFTCENDPGTCQDFVSCDIALGNAAVGSPAAGTPKAQLCNEVLDCVRDSGCAVSPQAPINCYCGTASGADCQAGLGNGACKTQIERGLETTSFNSISARFKNTAFGGGVALARIDCDQNACLSQCGL